MDTAGIFAEIFKDYKKPEKDIIGQLSDAYSIWQDWAAGKDLPEEEQKAIEAFNKFSGPGGMPLLQAGIKAAGMPAGKILGHASRRPWPGGYKAKPDIDKLYTGEGGTMYNPGLYTGENMQVPQSYRQALAEGRYTIEKSGKKYDRYDIEEDLGKYAEQKLVEAGIPKRDAYTLAGEFSDWQSRAIRSKEALSTENIYDSIWGISQVIDNLPGENKLKAAQDIAKYYQNWVKDSKVWPDSTLYQFLLKEKYLPKVLDLNDLLARQPLDVKASIRQMAGDLNKNLPTASPISRTMLEGDIAGAKATYKMGGMQPFDDYIKMLSDSITDPKAGALAQNEYWKIFFNPRTDQVILKARGSHYKGKHEGNFDTVIDTVRSDNLDSLFKHTSLIDPPDIMGQLNRPRTDNYGREFGNYTGLNLQEYINKIYHEYPGIFGDVDNRLLASGVFDKYGIPGNRYLDEGSRNLSWEDYSKGKRETKNYVLWGKELLNDLPILKIRGLFE